MADKIDKLKGTLNGSSASLDPAFVQFSPQWYIITNLGIHLTTYDKDSRLVPLAAKSWTVDSKFKVFRFELRTDVKDARGNLLTSADWRATFGHLLESNGSTHSFISEILDIEGILTPSPFILELRLKKPYKTLLQRLTSPEFILLPKSAIGKGSIDFSNSSGPYYISEKNSGTQEVILTANKHYFLYSPKQPTTINLSNFKGGSFDIATAIKEGRLNFALMSMFPTDGNTELVEAFIKNKQILAESVQPSNVALMVYSANSKLNIGQRLRLLDIFQDEGKNAFQSANSKPAKQFFPPHLHGSLSANDEQAVRTRAENLAADLPSSIKIICSAAVAAKGLSKWTEQVLKKFGVKYSLKIMESVDYRRDRNSIDHDLYIMSTGVNSKDPAGSLLDMIDSKGGLISDPDHKLINLLKTAALGSDEEGRAALHSLSTTMLLEGKIIPLFHFGTMIISSINISALPPTLYDDELRLHTIRWKQ